MNPKPFLVLMTVIAVVSDSMLHPFYPQYFAMVFGVVDPRLVGVYIGSCSLTVMLAFPLWALLSRRLGVLRLLLGTQLAAGVLSLVCWRISSLAWFWAASLGMLVFKASYLLIYPYVMQLQAQAREKQVGTIGLLAFVVYFGNILAALLSGLVFEWLSPRWLFVVMAVGDALQTLICLYLPRAPQPADAQVSVAPAPSTPPLPAAVPAGLVPKVGSVMLVLYFSAYLADPFFASYWERVSGVTNRMVSGLMFSIPGLAALLGVFVNARSKDDDDPYTGIAPALALGACGLALQASQVVWAVPLGRCAYGWALFQAMVRLDALFFRLSTPEAYALDFSKINLFQGLGVMLASLAAGALVAAFGSTVTLIASAAGLFASLLWFWTLFLRLQRGAVGTEGMST